MFVNLKKKLHLGKNEFNRIFSEMTLSLFFKLAQYTKNALSLKNGKKKLINWFTFSFFTIMKKIQSKYHHRIQMNRKGENE